MARRVHSTLRYFFRIRFEIQNSNMAAHVRLRLYCCKFLFIFFLYFVSIKVGGSRWLFLACIKQKRSNKMQFNMLRSLRHFFNVYAIDITYGYVAHLMVSGHCSRYNKWVALIKRSYVLKVIQDDFSKIGDDVQCKLIRKKLFFFFQNHLFIMGQQYVELSAFYLMVSFIQFKNNEEHHKITDLSRVVES